MTVMQEVADCITQFRTLLESILKKLAALLFLLWRDATYLANFFGDAQSEIVELTSPNYNVVASIATTAEEKSATFEEVNHAIDEINQEVSKAAEGMFWSSAAVQDLSHMAQELHAVMERLK